MQISAWLNDLTQKLEEAEGLDLPAKTKADVTTPVMEDLPTHLRPIVLYQLQKQSQWALSEYVWSRIHKLPGFIRAC